jgi:hypothetical protein
VIEVLWEDSGVLRRLSGVVSLHEFDSSGAEIQGDERTDALRYIIHDFTACTEVHAEPSDIEFLVARACAATRSIPKLKVAFVGNHPAIQTILDSHNELKLSQHEWRCFDSMASARQFISGSPC